MAQKQLAWVNVAANNAVIYQITDFSFLKRIYFSMEKDAARVNPASITVSLTSDPETANAVKSPNIIAVASDTVTVDVEVKFRQFQKIYIIPVDMLFEGTVGLEWERP